MPTSELSDALNPFAVPARSRAYSDRNHLHHPPQIPIVQQQHQYVPHRSELEYAISELPPPPPPPPPIPIPPRPNRLDAGQVVQELLRTLAATNQAQENERIRIAAWEKDMEAKYQQREAEMQTQLAEVKQELALFKAYVATVASPLPARLSSPPRVASPLLLEAPPTSFAEDAHMSDVSLDEQTVIRSPMLDLLELCDPVSSTSVSPHISAAPSPLSPGASSSRKRLRASSFRGDDGNESSASEVSRSSAGKRPLKRINKHDTRCYTMQVAARRHMYRVMEVEQERELPPAHFEGLPLEDSEPIRFVWGRTIKKSEHNTRMKARFVADLIANRRLYKHVPDADFNKKTIEAAFEQAYTTFRQKFKMQTDASVGASMKAKEEHKAMKSRRFSRRKIKLGNRTEVRKKTEAFTHATFDGALQLECMSSEESGDDVPKSAAKDKVLLVRGMPWRSTRLLRFYGILDEDDMLDKSMKPKRGVGRHDRNEGPPKDGFIMPPKGVASWMISRRWLNDLQLSHPELVDLVKEATVDPPGFDWTRFDALGYESDDESDPITLALRSQRLAYPSSFNSPTQAPPSTASYSLQDALASL